MSLFMHAFSRFLLAISLVMFVSPAFSSSEDIETLKKALAKNIPKVEITQVSESPVPGLFEVVVGTQIVYMDKTARYMIDGDLVDLSSRENYTERTKSKIRLTSLNALSEDNMLVYKPGQVDHTVTVVTDINCPYCRRLHAEMDGYMKNNIKVRYVFMPLKGQDDFDITVSVWCSKDRNKALDRAKAGEEIEKLTCDNPIKKHLALARTLGVRGTPAIILESGELIPGYVPVAKLAQDLKGRK